MVVGGVDRTQEEWMLNFNQNASSCILFFVCFLNFYSKEIIKHTSLSHCSSVWFRKLKVMHTFTLWHHLIGSWQLFLLCVFYLCFGWMSTLFNTNLLFQWSLYLLTISVDNIIGGGVEMFARAVVIHIYSDMF